MGSPVTLFVLDVTHPSFWKQLSFLLLLPVAVAHRNPASCAGPLIISVASLSELAISARAGSAAVVVVEELFPEMGPQTQLKFS